MLFLVFAFFSYLNLTWPPERADPGQRADGWVPSALGQHSLVPRAVAKRQSGAPREQTSHWKTARAHWPFAPAGGAWVWDRPVWFKLCLCSSWDL